MWRRNTAQRRGVWGGGGGGVTNALSATLVNHVIHVHAKLKFPVDNFFLGAFITWVAMSGPYNFILLRSDQTESDSCRRSPTRIIDC